MTTLPFRTRLTPSLAEGVSPRLVATLTDEAGVAIPLATLTTVTLTLYDLESMTIVNSRDHVDVLSLVSAGGVLTWQGAPADTTFVGTSLVEIRVALIEWSWSAGTRVGRHEVFFEVRNLGFVPSV